jgi:glutaredoxin 3
MASVVLYTTGYCGYCVMAKRLLDKKGVAYDEIRVDERPDLRSWLVAESGQQTVPQIFIHGESIGGFTELAALDRQGELDRKLATPPAVDNPALRS